MQTPRTRITAAAHPHSPRGHIQTVFEALRAIHADAAHRTNEDAYTFDVNVPSEASGEALVSLIHGMTEALPDRCSTDLLSIHLETRYQDGVVHVGANNSATLSTFFDQALHAVKDELFPLPACGAEDSKAIQELAGKIRQMNGLPVSSTGRQTVGTASEGAYLG